MELRVDKLLALLREQVDQILASIDADPLLIKRELDGLVLANAGKELFTPQSVHQLFAKGIVYQRNPYRLVSLPLLKIYNLGERNVTASDIERLRAEGSRLAFLRKYDGSMVQRFQVEGRVYFSTRGVLEGIDLGFTEGNNFDYVAAARQIAAEQYPLLTLPAPELEGLTLILELIHPEGRVITDYGDRRDLILLAIFDHHRHAYWPYERLQSFAGQHGFTLTDALNPTGTSLVEQIDALHASLAGSDQEGSVVVIESAEEVIYRVKLKSPDYLRLLKLMVNCTYWATQDMLDQYTQFPSWLDFEVDLQKLGTESVPEEVMAVYREHYQKALAYRRDCERLQAWALERIPALRGDEQDVRVARKAFAQRALQECHPALLFSAYDGRLSVLKVREYVSTPEEASEAIRKLIS
jgi:hypothetical protein